jgi:threonine/homoserine/homoserine lactone efflux protein
MVDIFAFWCLFYSIFLSSVAVGPVFITLANISINYGIKSGLFALIGVSIGNIFYMILGSLTAQKIIVSIPDRVMLFVSFGATILLIYVAVSIWRKKIDTSVQGNIEKPSVKTILKMLIITLSSPVVITGYSITFLTFASYVKRSFMSSLIGGICGALIAYFLVVVFFSFLGERIKKLKAGTYLKVLTVLNRSSSFLLIMFATIMAYKFFKTIILMFLN